MLTSRAWGENSTDAKPHSLVLSLERESCSFSICASRIWNAYLVNELGYKFERAFCYIFHSMNTGAKNIKKNY